ncbi:MAG TPA: NAD kinase [Bacteroidales bacterium]|nr:NAD kinase [Bacteroidales bacterium]
MRIAIFGRPFPAEYFSHFQLMLERLDAAGCSLLIYKPFLDEIRERITYQGKLDSFSTHLELKQAVQFLISIGGDGTLLDTITLVRDSGIPIVGINMGRLGFLSTTSRQDITRAFDELLAGNFELDRRSLIRLDSHRGHFGEVNYALNEVTIYKAVPNSMISVQTWVDGQFLNTYWADGLIVATPTGSTAYSLSCGGPIIVPGCENFVITPIASHNLTVRPVVIPDASEIRIQVDARGMAYTVSLDSRMLTLSGDAALTLRRAGFYISLVRLPQRSFFQNIREKLSWGLDKRN